LRCVESHAALGLCPSLEDQHAGGQEAAGSRSDGFHYDRINRPGNRGAWTARRGRMRGRNTTARKLLQLSEYRILIAELAAASRRRREGLAPPRSHDVPA